MRDGDIYEQLNAIFSDVFDDDSIVLTPETTAADIPGWDSAAHVDLIVSIETRMKIKFKTTEIGSLHNVGQLVHIIERKREAVRAA
jgi:acyl carrier protein